MDATRDRERAKKNYLSWRTKCGRGIALPTTHTVYHTPSGCGTPHGALGTLLHAQSTHLARVNAMIVTRALALSRGQAQHLGWDNRNEMRIHEWWFIR